MEHCRTFAYFWIPGTKFNVYILVLEGLATVSNLGTSQVLGL